MVRLKLAHEIRCDADTFWKVFFDREYNEKLYRGALGFPSFEILDQSETDKEIVRICKAEPKMTIPGPVTAIIGKNFGYREEGRFDKATQVWSWKAIPTRLADKIRNEGVLRLEPAGEGRVCRLVEITVEAKIFAVGGIIESSAESQLSDGWASIASFMNDVWLAKT